MVRSSNSWTRFVVVIVVVIVAAAIGIRSGDVSSADVERCWYPPVAAATVGDPFRQPACRWCAGNRGIDYVTAPGSEIRSVATGTVTYSGSVAGTQYLVVDIGGGRRVTYGGLAERRFRRGDVVAVGRIVATTSATFHLGVRQGDEYVDPAPFIGRLVGRVRLVPSNGEPGPPSRTVLRCQVGSGRTFR